MLATLLTFALLNAAVLGGLLLAVFFSRRCCFRSRLLLATIILLALWNEGMTVLVVQGTAPDYPLLVRSTFLTRSLIIVLFYFYVRSLIESDFQLSKQHPAHLAPLLLGVGWLVFPWVAGYPDLLSPSPAFYTERYWHMFFRLSLALPYLFASLVLIRKYERRLKAEYANASDFKLTWLKSLSMAFLAILIFHFADVLTGPQIQIWLFNPLLLAGSLVLFTFVALRTSSLPSLDAPPPAPVLSEAELQRLKEKLLRLMNEDKTYLNAQIRLRDLAEKLGSKSYRLTEVLNRGLKTSFNDFINGYRIEHAKSLMVDPAHAHESILAIAFESGFSSKSTFNEIFKRNVGLTPSRFRERAVLERANGAIQTSRLGNADA